MLDPGLRSPLPPTGAFEGDVASAALYAGGWVGAVTGVVAVVRELLGDADAVLRRATVDRRGHGG